MKAQNQALIASTLLIIILCFMIARIVSAFQDEFKKTDTMSQNIQEIHDILLDKNQTSIFNK